MNKKTTRQMDNQESDALSLSMATESKEPELCLIQIRKIKQSDELSFREKTNPETIDRYCDRWIEYKEEQEETDEPLKPPFPPIYVLKVGKDKYVVVAGVHRLMSAQKAGLTEILCIVITDRKEAVVRGAQDNQEHGLQSSRGDLRQCIKVVKKEFGEALSNRKIARILKCSHTYVNRICDELEVETVSTQSDQEQSAMNDPPVPQEVTPTPENVETAPSVEAKIEKTNEVVVEDREEATDNISAFVDNVSENVDGDDHNTGPNTDGSDPDDVFLLNSHGLQDIDDDAFVIEFGDFIRDLPIDDERRLALFPKLIKRLLSGLKKRESRDSLRGWFIEYLEPCAQ